MNTNPPTQPKGEITALPGAERVARLAPDHEAYIILPIGTGEDASPLIEVPERGVGRTVECVKSSGPEVTIPGNAIGLIPFRVGGGIPYPTFVFPLFPFLQTVRARGELQVVNPFFSYCSAMPDRIRISAWALGWDRSDLESLHESCKSVEAVLQEWNHRAHLWGRGPEYQISFLRNMAGRLSSLVDLAESMGMVFGGELVGWNVWQKSDIQSGADERVAQTLVDLWRVLSDLVALRYIDGFPSADRPVDADSIFAERFSDLVRSFSLALGTLTSPTELTPCERDIRQTLTEANRRLTTTPLIGEMQQRDREYGESTIKQALARMVGRGDLNNRQDVRPKGYGLPEWTNR
jgi:hypothetical protein